MEITIPRPEYPRPDFQRANWLNLNGPWEFAFDDEDAGEREQWFSPDSGDVYDRTILVPYCCQSRRSGIGDPAYHKRMWYRRSFRIPDSFSGKRVLLRFGAVDEFCRVWVNGVFIGSHRGGYSTFQFDLTDVLRPEGNVIAVMAEDDRSVEKPRGKQYWKDTPESIWYTPTSGIWQTVWLEAVGETYMDAVYFTPMIAQNAVRMDLRLDHAPSEDGRSLTVSAKVSFQESVIRDVHFTIGASASSTVIDIGEDMFDRIHLWTPETPDLYDVTLTLSDPDGKELDRVQTYFGMREICTENGIILLNHKPYRQKLVLDQGYWPDSLMTPPDDEAIRTDIRLAKEMGFNGARKHQKIEDPRYYYWADRMGFLVWGEMPSAYRFSGRMRTSAVEEWRAFLRRDYNHPSIVCWVPFNESWGIEHVWKDERQQNFARALYWLTKSEDPTRLVSTNDGWEQVTPSDICGIHDYAADPEGIVKKYADLTALTESHAQGRMLYARGNHYRGEPVLITEYGGIAFAGGSEKEWGYAGFVHSREEFLKRYRAVTEAFCRTPNLWGYCYTQLTDVQQEANGLLTASREPKVPVEWVRAVNEEF